MADPGFPRREAPTPKGGVVILLFGEKIPANCMKMKEIGLGVHVPGALLGSANGLVFEVQMKLKMLSLMLTFVWNNLVQSLLEHEISHLAVTRLHNFDYCSQLTEDVVYRSFLHYINQWQIQDFPKEGVPTPQGGANIRFCQIFPKTA